MKSRSRWIWLLLLPWVAGGCDIEVWEPAMDIGPVRLTDDSAVAQVVTYRKSRYLIWAEGHSQKEHVTHLVRIGLPGSSHPASPSFIGREIDDPERGVELLRADPPRLLRRERSEKGGTIEILAPTGRDGAWKAIYRGDDSPGVMWNQTTSGTYIYRLTPPVIFIDTETGHQTNPPGAADMVKKATEICGNPHAWYFATDELNYIVRGLQADCAQSTFEADGKRYSLRDHRFYIDRQTRDVHLIGNHDGTLSERVNELDGKLLALSLERHPDTQPPYQVISTADLPQAKALQNWLGGLAWSPRTHRILFYDGSKMLLWDYDRGTTADVPWNVWDQFAQKGGYYVRKIGSAESR